MKEIKIFQSSVEKLSLKDVVVSAFNGKWLFLLHYAIHSNMRSGFVDGAIKAYNKHYRLVCAPRTFGSAF